MSGFDWSNAAEVLSGFGGEPVTLNVPKTGLPFFDVIRLYGAIDLYIGLREEVTIHDSGNLWEVKSLVRKHRVDGRVRNAAKILKEKELSKHDDNWLCELDSAIKDNNIWPAEPCRNLKSPLDNPDSVLKDGIRDKAALKYKSLESGCGEKTKIPWADAVLAFAGQRRVENISNIMFLPVFEGKVDFSKIISPLRAWLLTPNVLCAQALMLLALKISLFAEGYQDRLNAVVYNTNLDPRKNFNYSGLIRIESTAIGKMTSPKFIDHAYNTFRKIVSKAWTRKGKSTELTPDALAMTHWLMQPVGKYLSSMITSQERFRRGIKRGGIYRSEPTFFDLKDQNYVKEIFEMSYGKWQGDHEAVRKFAKAVASAIFYAREKKVDKKDKGKAWYDEVTMLRSASSAKLFIERAMILIEQGHKEHDKIATEHWQENFDPAALLASIGEEQNDFVTFRDLFRMYLVQESTWKGKTEFASTEEELETDEESGNEEESEGEENSIEEGDEE